MTDIKPKMTNPIHFLAFCGGVGLIPFAPGTWGSLVGVVVFYLTLAVTSSVHFFDSYWFFYSGCLALWFELKSSKIS